MTSPDLTPAERLIEDTYVAALQHDHVEPASGDFVVGVVRKPMYGLESVVDSNWSQLGPEEELLDELKALTRSEDVAQRAAVEACEFDERYRSYLGVDGRAQRAMWSLLQKVRAGTRVWLVCFENTEEKYCHRETLRDRLCVFWEQIFEGDALEPREECPLCGGSVMHESILPLEEHCLECMDYYRAK